MGRVIEKGPTTARYMDRDIPSYYIDARGRKHIYIGLAPQTPPHSGIIDLNQLTPNQSVLAPGLLYEVETIKKEDV